MKTKLFLIITLTFFAFGACVKSEESVQSQEKQTVVFVSSVNNEDSDGTRAIGASWSANDAIGIFMKKTGQELSASNILNDADNLKYITASGSKYFTPADISESIFFPESENVDFIAYYPYKQDITDYEYNIDLSDQSSLEKLDLLYSDNAVNAGPSVGTVNMSFSRQLTKLKFGITTNEYVTSLNGLTVTVSGQCTKGVFNLSNGQMTVDGTSVKDFNANTVISGATATSEAIVFPIDDNNQTVVTFTLPDGREFKHQFPSSTKFEKGVNHKYDIVLKGDPGTSHEFYDENRVELPAKTSIDNTIFIAHNLPSREGRNYSMLYDEKYRLAYWVAYPLCDYYLGGSGVNELWQYDPLIIRNSQPYLRGGWGTTTNFDRGHQIPPEDRTYNSAENNTTFYYSNITARNRQLDQGIWADLERQVRTWAASCDTMYVVTGAMITTKTDKAIEYIADYNGTNIAKPKYYYKALAQRVGDTYYTVAYKINNESPSSPTFNSYRLTVDELEEETGFTFFPSISNETKSTIETNRWQ